MSYAKKAIGRREGAIAAVLLAAALSVAVPMKADAGARIDALTKTEQTVAKDVVKWISKDCPLGIYMTKTKLTASQAKRISKAVTYDLRLNYYFSYVNLVKAYDYDSGSKQIYAAVGDFKKDYLVCDRLYRMGVETTKNCVRKGITDAQKVRAINNYLCAKMRYVDNRGRYVNQATMLSWLKNWKGCCDTYAHVFRACCLVNNINCRYVYGTAVPFSRTEDHAWNGVRLNGVWHHVDVCWNDTTGHRTKYLLSRKVWSDHRYSRWRRYDVPW